MIKNETSKKLPEEKISTNKNKEVLKSDSHEKNSQKLLKKEQKEQKEQKEFKELQKHIHSF